MLATSQSLSERLAKRIERASLKIEQAKPAEMDALGRFRYRIYIEQTGKDAAHADHANRMLLEPLDAVSVNLIARDDEGEIVGAVRISKASDGWRLPEQCYQNPWPWVPAHQIASVTRLVVDRETAPLMTMPALFAECYRWGVNNSIRLCVVFCGPNFRTLFESYGCQQFDKVYSDQFVGDQVPMLSCLNDRNHLIAVNSPFLHLVGDKIPHPRDIIYMRTL